jgi:hypothetical protein
VQTLAPITGLLVGASGCSLFARILGSLAVPITQASIISIAYTVTDLTSGFQLATELPLPTSCVLNNLVQNDPLWTQDSMAQPGADGAWGYNVLINLPASSLPGLGPNPIDVPVPTAWAGPMPLPDAIQIDVFFTAVGGATFRIPWVVNNVVPVYG